MTDHPLQAGAPVPLSLRLGRGLIIAYALFLTGLLLVGVFAFPGYARQHASEFTPNAFWSAQQTQAALAELDWPDNTLAMYYAAVDILATLVSISFAIFLLWRKSRDWFGLYMVFVFLNFSGSNLIDAALTIVPWLSDYFDLLGTISWQIGFILFYLFPDGRFVPRWTRWMPLIWLGVNLPEWLFSSLVFNSPLGLWIGMGLVMSAIGSQVYRYGWRSTPVQRQQTKWLVAGLAVMSLFLIFMAPSIFKAPPEQALGTSLQWALLGGAIFRLSFLLIPAAIIFAIFRYRLYDIDVIIRRTLQYTLLSGLLALVYFGGVTILQSLFSAISGQQSPAALVISTLAIAALFNPLRRRIQDFIDRRFYRQKYDAEQALASFAAAARSETELESLTTRLTATVQETLQPEQARLWLKPNPKDVDRAIK